MPIANPILPGSHPDPALIRVDDTYYLVNSTFEWWPALNLHRSTDLRHWRPLPSPITSTTQLDLRGDPSGFGVWAPDLSYAHGRFWLVYSNVASVNASFTDCHNYLMTAERIEGPWSDPIALNVVGFDARMFHDDDGRSYLVQQTCDFREYKPPFAGITLTEFDVEAMRLKPRTARIVWKGSGVGAVEGPHLYHIGDWYYLFAAEGGTSYGHRESVARSRTLDADSFEPMPGNPLLTSADDASLPLQKQGHASLVDTPEGAWYIVHLCARPWQSGEDVGDDVDAVIDADAAARGWSTLGRETALQRIVWDADGWPRVVGGAHGLQVVPSPDEAAVVPDEFAEPAEPIAAGTIVAATFGDDGPATGWKTLRGPLGADVARFSPGQVRLRGQDSPCSLFDVSLVARPWTAVSNTAGVRVDFRPWGFQQMAGLIEYYGSALWSAIVVTWNEDLGSRVIEVIRNDDNMTTSFLRERAPRIPDDCDGVWLRVDVDVDRYRYLYSFDGVVWNDAGVTLDARMLTDEHAETTGNGFFTGAFVGVFATDMTGYGAEAIFSEMTYVDEEVCDD